jgi:agmatine deiminase
MAWPWDGNIWNHIPGTSLKCSQDAFDRLVRTVLNYENVSLLARDIDAAELERRFKSCSGRRYQVEIIVANYNDIWVRDTLPTFAISDRGSLVAVNWNFNGWGRRVRPYASYGDDAQLCSKIAALTGAELVDSGVTAEGGAFAFDEDNLTIATKSVMFDRFRNPSSTKAELENAIVKATGRKRICWLPGDRNEPITSGHADSLVAFGRTRNVLVNWISDEMSAEFDVTDYNRRVLQTWSDRENQDLHVIRLPAARIPGGFSHCSSYINFAHINGGIIVPEYGDVDGDKCAKNIISEAFGSKPEVVSVDVRAIAAAGGSIHCATLQEPATEIEGGNKPKTRLT